MHSFQRTVCRTTLLLIHNVSVTLIPSPGASIAREHLCLFIIDSFPAQTPRAEELNHHLLHVIQVSGFHFLELTLHPSLKFVGNVDQIRAVSRLFVIVAHTVESLPRSSLLRLFESSILRTALTESSNYSATCKLILIANAIPGMTLSGEFFRALTFCRKMSLRSNIL
jgi:hypothetical protein